MSSDSADRLRTIGSVSRWMSGGTPDRSKAHYWQGDIPWISAFTLKRTEIFTSDQFISIQAAKAGSRMAPINSTLLLVRGSALHKEIRTGIVVAPVAFNQDVKALLPSAEIEPKYLTFAIQGNSDKLLRLVTSAGNTAGVLDTKVVQDFQIWIPERPEQREIVERLNDVDALISSLEKLLDKKHAIQQGMMQELLTGHTRLSGFTQPWETVGLGDLADFSKGMGLPKCDLEVNGQYPCVHYGELFTRYDAEIKKVTSRTNNANLGVRSLALDVLMPTSDVTPRGLAKASSIHDEGVILGGDILIIRPDASQLYGPFLAHVIRHDASQILQLVRGSTVFHIYAADMKSFKFQAPPADEQRAICRVFRSIQQELELLDERLRKARIIKQGMMQQLLTGRTRLKSTEFVS